MAAPGLSTHHPLNRYGWIKFLHEQILREKNRQFIDE